MNPLQLLLCSCSCFLSRERWKIQIADETLGTTTTVTITLPLPCFLLFLCRTHSPHGTFSASVLHCISRFISYKGWSLKWRNEELGTRRSRIAAGAGKHERHYFACFLFSIYFCWSQTTAQRTYTNTFQNTEMIFFLLQTMLQDYSTFSLLL